MARRQCSTSHWQRAFAPVVLGFVLLAGWQALTVSGTVPASLLPAPGVIWERLVADLAEGRLWPRIWITVKAALLGCLLATSIALPLGYLVARNKVAESALSPYLAASQAIPAVALAPLWCSGLATACCRWSCCAPCWCSSQWCWRLCSGCAALSAT